MRNQIGKTLTIFVVLVTILLISSTAIGFFMYQKETQLRKDVEAQFQEAVLQQKKLADELAATKSQMALLEDKNKEADKKINSLMDEIELNSGLHTAIKKENASLKESLETAKKDKETIRAELDHAAKRLQENQEMLKAEQRKIQDLLIKVKEAEDAKLQAEAAVPLPVAVEPVFERELVSPVKNKMELGKIIVADEAEGKARILSIDATSEFVICSIGIQQGVTAGDVLAVYRGDRYLGDVKVSRAQDQMSAADFVPPLSSRKVRKNDIVVLKRS